MPSRVYIQVRCPNPSKVRPTRQFFCGNRTNKKSEGNRRRWRTRPEEVQPNDSDNGPYGLANEKLSSLSKRPQNRKGSSRRGTDAQSAGSHMHGMAQIVTIVISTAPRDDRSPRHLKPL